jgi:hypothetical protein
MDLLLKRSMKNVMPGLVPGIHVLFFSSHTKTWMAGHTEATPFFERLCPAMTGG